MVEYSIMGKKGRNRNLINIRDRKILERFIYWTEEQRLRSDDAIRQLSEEEFFLSEATIIAILKKAESMAKEELHGQAGFLRPKKLPTINKEMLNSISKK